MAKFTNKGKPASRDINVTPLIDVVLVLLIIFMVITPIFIYETHVKVAEKKDTPSKPPDFVPAKVAVCSNGSFAFNEEVMSLRDLSTAIADNIAARPELPPPEQCAVNPNLNCKHVVSVDSHPDAHYEDVVRLIDTVVGSAPDIGIGIATLKEEGEFNACGSGT